MHPKVFSVLSLSTLLSLRGRLALLAVFLFWIPIVVAISGWTTLSSIQGTVPAVEKFLDAHPALASLMSGVLATAALKIFMMFLPSVLHFIITTTLHLKAGSVEQLKLQQWSTAFLLLFVVLVTSLGRGLTITFFIVMQEGTSDLWYCFQRHNEYIYIEGFFKFPDTRSQQKS